MKLVKCQLNLLLRLKKLSDDELQTLVRVAQRLVNTRPVGVKDHSLDGEVKNLSPFDFLDGAMGRLPMDCKVNEDMDFSKRTEFMQRQFENLWSRLQQEFFPQRATAMRKTGCLNFQLDDVVAVRGLNKVKGEWNLGRILELHAGRDRVARAATVKMKGKTMLVGMDRLSLIARREA